MKWEDVTGEQAQRIKDWFENPVFLGLILPLIAFEQDELSELARKTRNVQFLDESEGMGKVVALHDKAIDWLAALEQSDAGKTVEPQEDETAY